MEEYLSRKNEQGIIVRNWKKVKVKIEKLSKITILDEQEPSVQSADRTKAAQVWGWGNTFIKTRKLAIATSLSENKYGCHAGENPCEETISESSQIRELNETINLLNEEVTFSNASAKAFVCKPR